MKDMWRAVLADEALRHGYGLARATFERGTGVRSDVAALVAAASDMEASALSRSHATRALIGYLHALDDGLEALHAKGVRVRMGAPTEPYLDLLLERFRRSSTSPPAPGKSRVQELAASLRG